MYFQILVLREDQFSVQVGQVALILAIGIWQAAAAAGDMWLAVKKKVWSLSSP
jgi:hypothetical protein